MIIASIILSVFIFLACIYLAIYLFFTAIIFIIYSLDVASGGRVLSPELKAEFNEIRKKFSIQHFLRLITFFKK